MEDGVLADGILLEGMSLGGSVLGVVPVFGEHGPAVVEVAPVVPAVPLAPGVVLPMVPAGVPLVVELVLPEVVEVPFVPQFPTVVAVAPLGTVDWLGVAVLEELGLVVLDWLGVVVDWLGVVVADCDGVTPVELGVPGVVEGVVDVADGVVWVADGVVAVVPGWVLGVPAVPVPEPVVCAAATPMATVRANEANKIFFIKIAPWSGLNGRSFCCLRSVASFIGMPFDQGRDGICWPQQSVTVQ